jgi:hypothetical protein
MLTAGQDHDLACAEPLLENTNPGAVIADKAYDADAFIADSDDVARPNRDDAALGSEMMSPGVPG